VFYSCPFCFWALFFGLSVSGRYFLDFLFLGVIFLAFLFLGFPFERLRQVNKDKLKADERIKGKRQIFNNSVNFDICLSCISLKTGMDAKETLFIRAHVPEGANHTYLNTSG